MEKKSKKKLWIVLLIVLLLVLSVLTVGYFAVDRAFSVITDSFYKSSEPVENPSPTPQESGVEDDPAGNEAENGQTPSTDAVQSEVSSAISSAAERYGISAEVFKLSPAEIKELEKKVSFSDKVAVLNILSSGLSAGEYKELIGMLNDGVNHSDMQRAYQILSKSLSRENKEKILQYYQKYAGLLK